MSFNIVTSTSLTRTSVSSKVISIKTTSRASAIRMIFQDAGTSLNPSLTIKQLFDEPLILNTDLDEQ